MKRKHNHYFKDVSILSRVDVYRVLQLFEVTDPCLQHAIKKLLVAGGRGAGKDITQDIKEAVDSLERWQEMRREDESPNEEAFRDLEICRYCGHRRFSHEPNNKCRVDMCSCLAFDNGSL